MRSAVSPAADLVGRAFVRYQQWREEADASAAAYRRWCRSPLAGKSARYGAYVAALDQEEYAARAYARALAQLKR